MENKQHSILQPILAFALGAGLAAAMAWFYFVFVYWQPTAYAVAVALLCAGVLLLTLWALRARGERKPVALIWKTALSFAVFLALLIGVTYVLNNVAHAGAALAAKVAIPLCALQIATLLGLLLLGLAKQAVKTGLVLAGTGIVAAVAAAALLISQVGDGTKHLTREGLPPYEPGAGRTAIHFLSTGGGDAILLESDGLFALIDAAEDSDNLKNDPSLAYDGFELYVLDYIKRAAGGKLDFILGTHAHSDHIGGFDTLLLDPDVAVGRAYLKRYEPAGKLGYELGWDNEEVYGQMVDALAARDVPLIQDIPEGPFTLGSFTVTIFNGEYNEASLKSGDENANSMGVLAEAFGQRAFLGGDMNDHAGTETRLAPQIGKVDLIKAPHHGHEGSSTGKFVSTLQASAVVVTSGPGGGAVAVLRRYARAGARQIMCTGDFGGVVAVFGEGEITYYAIGEYPSGIAGVHVERR
ncbi:MAG: MBL fold metallo-hydrolase [Oscillospiraceae bacterium]|nr:MBL fold metallo-hydrolase [Oscillospiraceae bacterium]